MPAGSRDLNAEAYEEAIRRDRRPVAGSAFERAVVSRWRRIGLTEDQIEARLGHEPHSSGEAA